MVEGDANTLRLDVALRTREAVAHADTELLVDAVVECDALSDTVAAGETELDVDAVLERLPEEHAEDDRAADCDVTDGVDDSVASPEEVSSAVGETA